MAHYVRSRRRDIRVIWLSSSPRACSQAKALGLECYLKYSLQGFYWSLRAKIFFITHHLFDVNPFVSGGAEVVQLWHGIPLKRIEFDALESPIGHWFLSAREPFGILLRRAHTFRKAWLVATSKESAEKLASGLQVPRERVWITGYPRNDCLFGRCRDTMTREEKEVFEDLQKLKKNDPDRWIGLYAPTFRWGGTDVISYLLRDPDKLAKLNEVLIRSNAYLFIKLHAWDSGAIGSAFTSGGEARSRVRFLTIPDVYPLLEHFDFLSTDYSSIFFDYLLLNRPILFFPYDLAEYQWTSRKFYYSYEEVTPGPKAYDFDQWLIELARIRASARHWEPARLAVRDRFFAHWDGNSSRRLLAQVEALLGLDEPA